VEESVPDWPSCDPTGKLVLDCTSSGIAAESVLDTSSSFRVTVKSVSFEVTEVTDASIFDKFSVTDGSISGCLPEKSVGDFLSPIFSERSVFAGSSLGKTEKSDSVTPSSWMTDEFTSGCLSTELTGE